jgi:toxin ParE1/3/4
MPRILRTTQAEEDLIEIMAYLGQHSRRAADRLSANIEKKCAILAQFPELGTLRDELAPNLRSFPVGKYILFYQPIEDGILLVRVLHGARDIPSLFD